MKRGLIAAMSAVAVGVAAASVEARQGRGQGPDSALTPFEQQMVDRQLAERHLDPLAAIAGLKLTSTPVKDILDAIAKAGAVTLRYDADVVNLDKPYTVNLPAMTVDEALRNVLGANTLAFVVTGPRAVFIYADSEANREKYTESVRTFKIANAGLQGLVLLVNRAITAPVGPRPTIITGRDSNTITVRATTELMSQIAKVIAENDKK